VFECRQQFAAVHLAGRGAGGGRLRIVDDRGQGWLSSCARLSSFRHGLTRQAWRVYLLLTQMFFASLRFVMSLLCNEVYNFAVGVLEGGDVFLRSIRPVLCRFMIVS